MLKDARERSLRRVSRNCAVTFCSLMKGVLEHLTQCTNENACALAHCSSSRRIIKHWRNCSREHCPICQPVRKEMKKSAAVSDGIDNSQIQPLPPSEEKPWHHAVSTDLRQYLITKTLKAAYPPAWEEGNQHGSIPHELVDHTRRVEKSMFERAGDKEEYCHLLAEKIYTLQKALERDDR